MLVTSVHDGDTFSLVDGQRVKLLGVNAPELGLCMAEEAKNKLKELVLNKKVKLTEEKRDTYGRIMGLIYVDNKLINEIMLSDGFARPDYTPNSKSEILKQSYKIAVSKNLGIHKKCKKVNPKPTNPNCVIKGNIDPATGDHFYHLPKCRHYNYIVLNEDLGEGFFCLESEASAAGFRLAPDCLR